MNSDKIDAQSFSKLADSWWDPNGKLKTLHLINPVRINYTNNACDLGNKSVLDVGCGGGIFSEAMARLSARVTALDISEAVILTARKHAEIEDLEIEYLATTIEDYAHNNLNKFDVITCMELLEHVNDPASVIESMAKLLRPGGDVFFSTINRTLSAYIKSILIAEHIIDLIPKATHSYSQFIKPSELSQLLRSYGFKVIDITGLQYIPGIDYVSLTDNLSVNYMLHAKYDG